MILEALMRLHYKLKCGWRPNTIVTVVLSVCTIGVVCLALTGVANSSRQSKFPTQVAESPAQGNTCRCEPPIPSQATATGSCTRTQDDGTFCELTFSLTQRARLASQSAAFDGYAAQAKISKDDFVSFMFKLEARNEPRKTEEAAISIKAAAILAAFQHQNDETTQQHFRDILEMLQTAADQRNKGPIWQSLERFASNDDAKEPLFEKMSVNTRTYQLVTTAGCIDFNKDHFTFMVRTGGKAPPCDRPRQ
jgi:hypothetical protein